MKAKSKKRMPARPKQRMAKSLAKPQPRPLQQKTSVAEAGKTMRSLQAKKFPVAAGNRLVGTIEGEFPDRAAAGFGHDPSATLVGETMTRKKFFCYEHQAVKEVKKIMQKNHLHHLPVVDGDLHIIGIVALKDL